MAEISVVVPIFQEEAVLPELTSRLVAVLSGLTRYYEILYVLDGGGDRSWEVVRELSEQNSRIKGVEFSRNFGQHLAITAGLDHCDGDWVVVMDGDLQDRPEVIPELHAKAMEGYDVVFVVRRHRPESRFYQFVVRVFHRVFEFLSGSPSNPDIANFSIISRKVVNNCCRMRENLRYYGGLVNWLGFRRAVIHAEHGERLAGTPGYDWFKRFGLAMQIILAHTDRPLHLAVALGIIMSLGSLVGALLILYLYFFREIDVPGYASIMVAIFFNGGLILGVLGLVGIYIGKIFGESKKRPLYIVDRTIGLDERQPPC